MQSHFPTSVFQHHNKSLTRRDFLRRTSALAVASSCGSMQQLVVGSQRPVPTSERIHLAVIGLGGMGQFHLPWFAEQPEVQVAALCDVDRRHLEQAHAILGSTDCPLYQDYREVLARDDIDAVVIVTPDHWHGLMATQAACAGKHVYCEKPLTNSVREGRLLCQAVQKHSVILQTGSHERSNPGARIAKQLVAEGRLGKIREVRIQLPMNEPHLNKVKEFQRLPQPTEPPAELDYEFWMGHTPEQPFFEERCHFWWRFYSPYGGGEMTDRGAHVIDLAQMILGLDQTGPIRFAAQGKLPPSDFYDAFVEFEFENHHADGLRMVGTNQGRRGLWLIGDAGKLFVRVHGAHLRAEPPELLAEVTLPETDAYADHRRDFLNAIRHGGEVAASAEAGHRTASICHLNNLAMRLQQPFTWDPVTEQSDSEEVNQRLLPPMREPWRSAWQELQQATI